MTITLTFKTPNVLDQVPLTEEQEEKLSKWIKYEEYITIEFDLKIMEAKVLGNK